MTFDRFSYEDAPRVERFNNRERYRDDPDDPDDREDEAPDESDGCETDELEAREGSEAESCSV